MEPRKKVRGDAVLKCLPEERQAGIYDLLKGKTLAGVKAELAQDGIAVSQQQLSEFHSWYALREALRGCEQDSVHFTELLKADMPELDEGKVAGLGEALFNLMAIRTQDPQLFLAMQTARHRARMEQMKFDQKERELALDERRVKLLEEKAKLADEAGAVVGSAQLSDEEKLVRMKEIFGITN